MSGHITFYTYIDHDKHCIHERTGNTTHCIFVGKPWHITFLIQCSEHSKRDEYCWQNIKETAT